MARVGVTLPTHNALNKYNGHFTQTRIIVITCQLAFLTRAKIWHFWGTVCPRKRVVDN